MIYTLLNLTAVSSMVGILVIGLRYLTFKFYPQKWLYYSWLFPILFGMLPLNLCMQKTKGILLNLYTNLIIEKGWALFPHQFIYKKQFDILAPRSLFQLHLPQILFYTWGIGFFLFLGFHMIANKKYKSNVVSYSKKATEETMQIFMQVKSQLGLSKDIKLLVSPLVISPVTFGLFKPYIILPDYITDGDELLCILQHEFIHIKRKDLLYKAILLICHAIHWYNPLFYMISRLLSDDCEISCDERVLAHASSEERMFYGETLLSTIQGSIENSQSISPGFYSTKNNLERRFQRMMNVPKRKRGWVPLIFVCMGSLYLSNITILAESTRPSGIQFHEEKIEAGKPIVEGSHSHMKVNIIQKEEDLKITKIVHGQGNIMHIKHLQNIQEERFTLGLLRSMMTWNFTLSANKSKKSSSIYMGQDDIITLRLKWAPGTKGEVKVGIMDEYGNLSYDIISHWNVEIQFEVGRTGKYRIYVENLNPFTVDISSDIIY